MSNVAAVRSNPAWNRRRQAAEIYRPKTIRLLLIAAGPPEDSNRYFYFAGDDTGEPLLPEVCEVLFEGPPPSDRTVRLKELRRRGVFLIDLRPDAPLGDAKPSDYADWLLLRLEELRPEHIVFVHPAAYDATYRKLASAKWPVSDVRIPFPAAGRAVEFRRELRTALIREGLEKLIRPLPSGAKSKRTKTTQTAEEEPEDAAAESKPVPESPPPRARAATAKRTTRARPSRSR